MINYLHRQGNRNPLQSRTLYAMKRVVASVGKQARPEAFTHIQRHSHATAGIARQFPASLGHNRISNLLPEEIEGGAYLHNVGKYFIQDSVLLKPASLDEDERAVMSLHPIYGSIIISRLRGTTEAMRRIVLYHHEHWRGTGCPEGLCGTLIPLEARVVSVVDVYTSLRSRRSYKSTLNKEDALDTLAEMAGQELDPYLVEDFIKCIPRVSVIFRSQVSLNSSYRRLE